jgi:hypothetical protein
LLELASYGNARGEVHGLSDEEAIDCQLNRSELYYIEVFHGILLLVADLTCEGTFKLYKTETRPVVFDEENRNIVCLLAERDTEAHGVKLVYNFLGVFMSFSFKKHCFMQFD